MSAAPLQPSSGEGAQGALRRLYLGNAAIARGLLEGGLQVAVAYPGTPSTEIVTELGAAAPELGVRVRWAVNEKVAAEAAITASMAGLRAMTAFKGVGANVAAESLQAFSYMGVVGGLVIVCADDPGLNSSHTEQDNRYFARSAYLPVLEPSTPAQAYAMAAAALDLSEGWGQPVMLRTTTAIAHTTVDLASAPLSARPRTPVTIDVADGRWMNLPPLARRMRAATIERLCKVAEAAETLSFNELTDLPGRGTLCTGPPLGLVSCGPPGAHLQEAVELLPDRPPLRILRLGMSWPLSVPAVVRFLQGLREVLVLEELEPFVEHQVAAIANQAGLAVPVRGKVHLGPVPPGTARGLVPLQGELTLPQVMEALCGSLGVPSPLRLEGSAALAAEVAHLLVPRPPELCAGCGHRGAFYAINEVERRWRKAGKGRRVLKPTDIGCYTLGYNPPLQAADVNLCMGASVGVAVAASYLLDEAVVCTIGDSTFLHAGLPPLIEAVDTDASVVVVVLDNGITAMTGHQPNPASGGTTAPARVSLEEVVRGCGVRSLRVIDALDVGGLVEGIAAALDEPGPSVVISRHPCALLEQRLRLAEGSGALPYVIDEDACTRCGICTDRLGCPAIRLGPGRLPTIDDSLCTGCGVCADVLVCRFAAIHPLSGP